MLILLKLDYLLIMLLIGEFKHLLNILLCAFLMVNFRIPSFYSNEHLSCNMINQLNEGAARED